MTKENIPNRIYSKSGNSERSKEIHLDLKLTINEYKMLLDLAKKKRKTLKKLLKDQVKKYIKNSKYIEMSFL
jgi:hypothetical protein